MSTGSVFDESAAIKRLTEGGLDSEPAKTIAAELQRLTQTRSHSGLQNLIIAVLVLLLGAELALLGASSWFSYCSYARSIDAVLAAPPVDHAAVLAYARARDFALVEIASLFSSFLLIFTGALYVLRTVGAAFEASAEVQDVAASLRTSSPGLVMITLAVALVAIVAISQSSVSYNQTGVGNQTGVFFKGERTVAAATAGTG